MIKAITLDYWDTIFKMENEFNPQLYRLEKLKIALSDVKVELDDNILPHLYKEVWQKFEKEWQENHYTMSTTETVGYILDKLQVKISQSSFDSLVKYFEEALLYHPPELMNNFNNIIQYLSENYKLGIISDTGFTPGRVLRELLKLNNLYQHFSYFIFSDEFGKSKPNPGTFLAVLDHFGIEPQEAIHIGDNERTDIAGAYSVGMKSILFARKQNGSNIETKADKIMRDWSEIQSIIQSIT
jgi:HAD superfamily hydrolase (TIGR01549 family)